MKRLLSFSLLGLFLLFGCEPTEETPEQAQLAGGVWTLQEANVQASGSAVIPGTQNAVPVSLTGTGEDYQMTVDFGETPQSVQAEGGFVLFVEISAAGLPLGNERFPIRGDENFAGTWEIKDGQLLMEDQDDTIVMDILEFSDNRLRVATIPDVSDFEEFDMEGVTVGEASAEFLLVR
ncbi:hypothetical protein [Cyclobacterium jeungdonense]|uniref:Lipocalin-like domain-containing protein n=1 Tax=Cyclobacterium jeungdonense TaxID=708087 RepID=A0ABT8C613_9BACT|nr:hypothetical protein [Cyclobacterium jeungdonense]MDN3687121.1 hypothetical protein [Cyclobacterium jeungdonense]